MWDGAFDQMMAGYALDTLAFGIIVAGADMQVSYANSAANRLFDAKGGVLRCVNGRLQANRARTQSELLAALARICGPTAPKPVHILATALDGTGADLAICILPVEATRLSNGPALAMLMVRPIERDCNLESEARELFGLTRAEARFASSVASGLSLLEAAKTHEVTLSTARTHMKNIFRKTGVSRQSQVAALLRGAQIPVQSR